MNYLQKKPAQTPNDFLIYNSMTQQDYTNQESLRRPEVSDVTKVAIKRHRVVTISRRTSENALLIMKAANKGHIYETASKWAERSMHWSRNSDFLSPIVASAHTPLETIAVPSEDEMNREIELSKKPPSAAEIGLFLDGLNAPDNTNSAQLESVPAIPDQDGIIQIADARARVDAIRNREAA